LGQRRFACAAQLAVELAGGQATGEERRESALLTLGEVAGR
jgi:hypothetical protein